MAYWRISSGSSLDTPMTCSAGFLCVRSLRWGTSVVHGPHELDQKSTITTLPARLASLAEPPPATTGRSDAGAGLSLSLSRATPRMPCPASVHNPTTDFTPPAVPREFSPEHLPTHPG